ncbi:MAG: SPOR domain-containing protein [Tatlockia sp.]|nr:SPOR domain-containing protein [Tatlockia sp.]
MFNKVRFLTLCIFSAGLTACATNEANYQNFQSYHTNYVYQPYQYQDTGYYSSYDYSNSYSESKARVPDSHYTGSYRSPTSHKDMDRNWVNSQNPKAYTIQIGEGEKASQVAGKLYKAPKSDRSAEIRYNRDGRSYYKGVYGSYNNLDDAQKALNNLPPEIKQEADIKSWSSVQENSQ